MRLIPYFCQEHSFKTSGNSVKLTKDAALALLMGSRPPSPGAPGLRGPGQAPGAAAVRTDSVGWVLTQGHCFSWAELFTSLTVQTQGVFLLPFP